MWDRKPKFWRIKETKKIDLWKNERRSGSKYSINSGCVLSQRESFLILSKYLLEWGKIGERKGSVGVKHERWTN
jgi:hypothetical protein